MIIEKINLKSLLPIIGIISSIEVLSFLSYRTSWLNSLFFILVCLLTFIATYKKLGYGLLIIIAELCIGSEGHLFLLTVQGHQIGIRIGLFVTVLGVWLFKYASWKRLKEYGRERTTQLFFLFLGVLLYSGLLGLLYHNHISDIIADGQRYVFFALYFVFLDVFKTPQTIYNLLKVLFATVITLTTKATLILILTMNNVANESATRLIYRWVRTSSRVGEITDMKNGFFRVFIQSQIFELVAVFVLTLFIAYIFNFPRTKDAMNRVSTGLKKHIAFYFSFLIITCFALIMGLSRSFWAAGAGTGLLLVITLTWRFKMHWKAIMGALGSTILAGLIGVVLINYVFGAAINNRVNASDPAASSRWKMLPPLISEIKKHPIIGSGIGTAVTYQSDDPRYKNEENPEGWHTTYAFEWGYLDFILKFGIMGTIVYIWFLGYLAWQGWKLTKHKDEYGIIAGGFLLGLIAVGATHMLSPYLNHPLGIGYVLICIGVFQVIKNEKVLVGA